MKTLQRVEKIATLHKFLEEWQEQTKKETLADTFFHFVAQDKKTAAKVVLEKMKKSKNSQWRIGYINALEGIITAMESNNDQNLLINNVKAEGSDVLIKVFLQHSRNELQSDFDKGFFSAWVNYMQALKQAAELR